ncbi:restriction endonuclease subunit S [Campylobacter jejuni]
MTNLPQGWEVKRLEEVCEVVMGQSPNGNCIFDKDKNKDLIEFHQGKIAFSDKYIDESNFVTSDVKKIAKKNSVVLCVRAPVGEVNITTKDIAIGRGLCSLNGVKINNNFLFFYLLTLKKYFNDNSTGSTFKAINVRVIKETKIPLPPLKEQERIVGILDFAFSKIDENIKKAKENLANIDELMQSALQKVFNPLNDNTKENYQLPQFWEWKSLNSVVLKTSNVNPCDFNDDKFYYIDISSIDNKNFCICSIKNIDKQYAPSRARKDVLYGDILYATTRPNLKNIAINYYNFNNIVGSTGFCVLRANENLNNKYLFFFLLSDIFDNYISKFIRGAQYPSVSDKDIFNSKIPLPPLKEQEQIAKHLDFVFEKAKALKELYTKELKDYEELKQSLLDKAFKGEL